MDARDVGGRAAVPGVAPGRDLAPATRLECDGEVFELRRDEFGGTHYLWRSGPNPGYGLSLSPSADEAEQHRTNIRTFLSMIDPRTGFIEDD